MATTEVGSEGGDDESEKGNRYNFERESKNGIQEIQYDNLEKEKTTPEAMHKIASATDVQVTFQQDHKKLDEKDIEEESTASVQENSHRLEIPLQPPHIASEKSSISSVQGEESDDKEFYEFKDSHQLRGRRFLLLISLFGGTVTLLITSLCFNIHLDSPARLPLIALFIIVYTLFYSVGAGAIPFLYCAEIFPNEGRGALNTLIPLS